MFLDSFTYAFLLSIKKHVVKNIKTNEILNTFGDKNTIIVRKLSNYF